MPAQAKARKLSSERNRLCAIFGAGLFLRLFYHLLYRPWWCGDSGGYTYPFWMWRHGYFSDGGRMPLYPLFLGIMALVARDRPVMANNPVTHSALSVHTANFVVALQSAMGLCATLLIYDMMRKLGVRSRAAFWAGLGFALIGGLCQFEMLLLTESTAGFALILSCWLFVRAMHKLRGGERIGSAAICAGLGFCAAVLVRTEMLVFFVVLLTSMTIVFWLVASRRKRRAGTDTGSPRMPMRSAWAMLLLMPLAAAPAILAWMSANYTESGQFRLTTMMGYQFYQSVYNLYDRVGPQDRVLGEIMVKHYRQTNADGHIKRDYLWVALDDIHAHAGEMPIKRGKHVVYHPDRFKLGGWVGDTIDLGDYMGGVARGLAERNPYAWLRNGVNNFFWDTFVFSYGPPPLFAEITAASDPRSVDMKNVVRHPTLLSTAGWINKLQAPVLCGLYVCTLGVALCGPILLIRNRNSETFIMDGTVAAMALSTVVTFASFCFLASYFPQYGAPFLGIMVVISSYALEKLLRYRH